mmetsp:Transcript_18996/g.23129  ORF Transcript_18996/g.23129 Transcript_18996/m.23129 type:complete len:115 (+) Transcript_18996:382-726(+)
MRNMATTALQDGLNVTITQVEAYTGIILLLEKVHGIILTNVKSQKRVMTALMQLRIRLLGKSVLTRNLGYRIGIIQPQENQVGKTRTTNQATLSRNVDTLKLRKQFKHKSSRFR